mmetsp:Transcript_105424/g.182223  ORF Transcript_105424/g.182223 Transcript_105424/m.182223 type:complete len:693 (-) Transcript_105424:121-2199(-)
MRTLVLCALALVFVATPVASIKLDTSATSSLSIDVQAAKARPVTKVVTLLKDMLKQLEKEAETDEDVYDKMACWCKTNGREKTESIKEAEQRIADLTTTIETSAARMGQLDGEIAAESSDLEKAEKSLAQLTSLRKQQSTDFTTEEKEMIESIKALEAAVVVLAKHHSPPETALLDESSLKQVGQVLKTQLESHRDLLLGVITPRQRRAALGLVQQEPRFRAYQPQSSEIFGILQQMKETFEANLAESRKGDTDAQKAYEGQKEAKDAEISAIKESLSQKKAQLASATQLNAQSQEDLEDTQNSLTVDEKFQMELEEKCKLTDEEWEVRQKMRAQELAAINEAIVVLSQDAAQDTFRKTFNPSAASFTQKAMRKRAARRTRAQKAASVLRGVALQGKGKRLELLALATSVSQSSGIDAFTRVKAAIDQMIAQLGAESTDEVKSKDSCVTRINENTIVTERKTREKTDTEVKIEGLKNKITELDDAIKTLENEIAELQVQMKQAGENRELENKDFQSTIADQRETQKLLEKAISVLSKAYLKTEALLQQNPPPPPGFSAYKKSEAGGGAVALLQQILSEAKVMEAEALKDEQDAQEQYETTVKSTNLSIEKKQASIVSKRADRGVATGELEVEKGDLQQLTDEIGVLENTKADLNMECDFLLKNFDLRQQARDEEIEALRQAKAILSGMQLDQ